MKQYRMKAVLESIVQRDVPLDMNLWPRIAQRVERRNFMQTVRTRPALALVLVLLILALLSGVAYAIGKVTGYIPGIGMVDQGEALRVLAEPVTITREGITLTIEQVVVSAERTILSYNVEGIPAEAYPDDDDSETLPSQSYSSVVTTDGTSENSQSIAPGNNRCNQDGSLLLPDGSTLIPRESQSNGWISGFEGRIVYDILPPETNVVIFSVPCIYGTTPGALPRDWEVPLQLVPAPSDLKVFPVIDITPLISAGDKIQSAMTLEQMIETDEGYILIGKFRSIGLPENASASGLSQAIRVTDANGHEIEASYYNDLEPGSVFGEFPWGSEIKGKQHVWPLTLTIDTITAEFNDPATEFEFDTGPNPHVGQQWTLNRDVELEGYTIRIVSIERTNNGYAFIFKADPDVTGITPNIKGVPILSGSGGNDGFGKGDLFATIEYNGEPPSGKLIIELGWLRANLHGPWQVQWSPKDILPTPSK